MYIFIENNNTKKGKNKRKKGKKGLGRTRTRHLRFDASKPNHYTPEAHFVPWGKVFNFTPFHETSAGELTELLTVKKQCKRIFHSNE